MIPQSDLIQHAGTIGRYYTVPGDESHHYHSVTTILSKSKAYAQNYALDKWNTANPGVANKCSNRGTCFHALVDESLKYEIHKQDIFTVRRWLLEQLGEAANDEEKKQHKDLYTLFIKVIPFLRSYTSVVATELRLHHPKLLYAGTADILLNLDGILLLADWKTSDTPKKNMYDNPCQLAAYIMAYNYLYGELHGYCSVGLIVNVPVEGDIKLRYYDSIALNKHWLHFKERLSTFKKRYFLTQSNAKLTF